jgi:hypothetical protein
MSQFVIYKLGRRPFVLSAFREIPDHAYLSSPGLVTGEEDLWRSDGNALLHHFIERSEGEFVVQLDTDGMQVTVDANPDHVTRVVSKNSAWKIRNDEDGLENARVAKFWDFRLCIPNHTYLANSLKIDGRREGHELKLNGVVTNVLIPGCDEADEKLHSTPEPMFSLERWSMIGHKGPKWTPIFSGFNVKQVEVGEPKGTLGKFGEQSIRLTETPFSVVMSRSAALPPCRAA